MEESYRKVDYHNSIETVAFKLSKEEFHGGAKPDFTKLPEGGPWKLVSANHTGNIVEVVYSRELGKISLLD